MKIEMSPMRMALTVVGLVAFFVCLAGETAEAASPELIGQLTKSLSITPAQASGGAGALFGLAKSRLNAEDFSKVAASVPGVDDLIKSAPAAPKNSATSGLSGITKSLPGGLGGLAAVSGQFKKLGLSPDMAAKFVPVLTQFVQSKGGAGVSSLLAGALK